MDSLHHRNGVSAALKSLWLARSRPTSGFVNCDAVGELVAPALYSARFRALCQAAGVPALRPIHNMRHTLATTLKVGRVPASIFGYDVQTFTRFYLVTVDEGAAEVAGRLFAV